MTARYLPTPPPAASHEAAAFWSWCRKRELRFQKCGACGICRHPPVPFCPHCQAREVDWVPAGAAGKLFSFTIVHHAVSEKLRSYIPYNIAIVEFPGLRTRLVTNVINLPANELKIGMPLRLVWQDCEDGTPLPLFAKDGI